MHRQHAQKGGRATRVSMQPKKGWPSILLLGNLFPKWACSQKSRARLNFSSPQMSALKNLYMFYSVSIEVPTLRLVHNSWIYITRLSMGKEPERNWKPGNEVERNYRNTGSILVSEPKRNWKHIGMFGHSDDMNKSGTFKSSENWWKIIYTSTVDHPYSW